MRKDAPIDAAGLDARRRLAKHRGDHDAADEATLIETIAAAPFSAVRRHLTKVRVRLFQLRPPAKRPRLELES